MIRSFCVSFFGSDCCCSSTRGLLQLVIKPQTKRAMRPEQRASTKTCSSQSACRASSASLVAGTRRASSASMVSHPRRRLRYCLRYCDVCDDACVTSGIAASTRIGLLGGAAADSVADDDGRLGDATGLSSAPLGCFANLGGGGDTACGALQRGTPESNPAVSPVASSGDATFNESSAATPSSAPLECVANSGGDSNPAVLPVTSSGDATLNELCGDSFVCAS